jgi:hypothetical protein
MQIFYPEIFFIQQISAKKYQIRVSLVDIYRDIVVLKLAFLTLINVN